MRGISTLCGVTGLVLDQHAYRRRQIGGTLVQVGLDVAVKVLHPTQHQLLADFRRQLGDGLLDRLVADLRRVEGIDVGGLGGQGGIEDLLREFLELGVLGDEVRFGVEFDQRAPLGGHQPLGGGPFSSLADILGTLDTQCFDGLVEIAPVGSQGVLAVQHARAGELSKPFDVGCGVVSHVSPPPSLR